VSAPRSIVLKQDVLLVINHDFLVVVGHHDCHRAVVRRRDRLALDARLDLARNEVIEELANRLLVDLLGLVIGILLVALDVLDGECRPLVDFQVQVASMRTKCLSINSREVNLALVLLGDGLKIVCQFGTLLRRLGEDVCEWDTGLLRKKYLLGGTRVLTSI
jgi:hypothetical protein